MRVRIQYTEDVADSFRRAINRYYGRPGLADRAAVVDWFRTYGESLNEDMARCINEESE